MVIASLRLDPQVQRQRLVVGVGGNLEWGNATVLSDRNLDVLDRAVGQEDDLVLACVERSSGVAEGHALNVKVPATERRNDDPEGRRFPLVAEPLNLLREFPSKEVAVKHSPGTLELAERFVEGLGEVRERGSLGIEVSRAAIASPPLAPPAAGVCRRVRPCEVTRRIHLVPRSTPAPGSHGPR